MALPEHHPLELSPAAMREMIEAATERVIAHVESLPRQSAAEIDPDVALAQALAEPEPPADGIPLDELLELVFERAAPASYNCAGPGYLGYVPGGGLFPSAVADLVANTLNRYVTVWLAAPGLVQLEVNVVRWFCKWVGYPDSAGGFLSSGGSLANFSAVVAARGERLGEDFLRGTIYTSDQTHQSVVKAARLAGFPARNVREIPSDGAFRLRLDAVAERLDADRRAGFEPFLVVANAGTTNTGAVDDLAACAELADEEKLWLHVDAAYGGFFVLTERGRATLAGLERADSITLDPHKSLFLPFGTGCLLVRNVDALRRAHGSDAAYMPTLQDDPDRVDFCQISPELSRDFRGLRVWLPLKLHGLEPFRRALDEKLDLAQYAEERLRAMADIELVAGAQLSTVAFRVRQPNGDGDDQDADASDRLNREILDRINRKRRVLLTGTILHGRFAIRICVLSFRTHRDRVDMCLDDLRAAIDEQREAATTALASMASP